LFFLVLCLQEQSKEGDNQNNRSTDEDCRRCGGVSGRAGRSSGGGDGGGGGAGRACNSVVVVADGASSVGTSGGVQVNHGGASSDLSRRQDSSVGSGVADEVSVDSSAETSDVTANGGELTIDRVARGVVVSSSGCAIGPRVSLVLVDVPWDGGGAEGVVLAGDVVGDVGAAEIDVARDVWIVGVERASESVGVHSIVETDGAARRTGGGSVKDDGTTSDGVRGEDRQWHWDSAVGTSHSSAGGRLLWNVSKVARELAWVVAGDVVVSSSSGIVVVGVHVVEVNVPSEVGTAQGTAGEGPVDGSRARIVDDAIDITEQRVVKLAG